MSQENHLKNFITEEFKCHRFERILPKKAIKAAVLMPLIEENGELYLLFERRSVKINQGGEICFPGGRIESGESSEEAAVRETAEELDIPAENIQITAPMFKMLGPAGADIFAYMGFINDYQGSFSEDEVDSVFKISVKELLEAEPKVSDTRFVQTPPPDFHYELIPGGRDYPWADIRRVYYFYETEFGTIWGMTGELLYHLLEKLKNTGIDSLL